MVFSKILRAGEGKLLRRLSKIADAVESLEDDVADGTAQGDPTAGVQISPEDAAEAVPGDDGPTGTR